MHVWFFILHIEVWIGDAHWLDIHLVSWILLKPFLNGWGGILFMCFFDDGFGWARWWGEFVVFQMQCFEPRQLAKGVWQWCEFVVEHIQILEPHPGLGVPPNPHRRWGAKGVWQWINRATALLIHEWPEYMLAENVGHTRMFLKNVTFNQSVSHS